MVLIVLERAPASLRGELSRWLMEISTGVFLGKVSALVRDELFELCAAKIKSGGLHMIHPWQCEQGFIVRSAGDVSRRVVDYDGIQLVKKPLKRLPRSNDEEDVFV